MGRNYICLGIVLIALMVSACNSHTERPPNPEQLKSHGQQIYVEFCAECHQTDGTGWDSFIRLAGATQLSHCTIPNPSSLP